jgi:predicted transcriptional regulator
MSVQISMRVSKEQKERLVELSKQQNKSLTQYVLDRCIIEDVDTNVDGSTHSSIRVEKMLQDQIEQLREDLERERTQLVDQIDQKDKQIADMIETSNSQLQLIGALTVRNETLLLEHKKKWWKFWE